MTVVIVTYVVVVLLMAGLSALVCAKLIELEARIEKLSGPSCEASLETGRGKRCGS